MKQNMAGEDTDVGGDDFVDVDDLDEILQNVKSEFSGKVRMISSHKL
jgi:hypothetical protein